MIPNSKLQASLQEVRHKEERVQKKKKTGRRTGEEETKKRKKKREKEIKKMPVLEEGAEKGMGEDHVILN